MMHTGVGGGNGPSYTWLDAKSQSSAIERDRLMAPRMLPNRIGKVAPVLTLLLVALLSVPSDAATKKAAHWNPFNRLS
jgi:hypothetical protein